MLYLVTKFNNKICSRHDIAEILLKLALSPNQSINQSINQLGWQYTNDDINILSYYILENRFHNTGYELKHTSLLKILQQ